MDTTQRVENTTDSSHLDKLLPNQPCFSKEADKLTEGVTGRGVVKADAVNLMSSGMTNSDHANIGQDGVQRSAQQGHNTSLPESRSLSQSQATHQQRSGDVQSQQIPPIHDIQIPRMNGPSSLGNGNLLGSHANLSDNTGTSLPQFIGNTKFSGDGQFMQIPRPPSLQDVTSGPELLKRSNSVGNSAVGVGIPHQLVDVSQSILGQNGVNNGPVLQTTGTQNKSSAPKDSNQNKPGTIPYTNMLTNTMLPMNQMALAMPPHQRTHSNPGSQTQPHSHQQSMAGNRNQQQQLQQQQQQQRVNNQQRSDHPGNVANPNAADAHPPKKNGRWSGKPLAHKEWHRLQEHENARKEMKERIVKLLEQRRPNASPEWYQKLPQMAIRLEEALYSEAQSFEKYNDPSTLKGRLQQLALSMSGKVGSKTSNPGAGVPGSAHQPVPQDPNKQHLYRQQQAQMPQSRNQHQPNYPIQHHPNHGPPQGSNSAYPHNGVQPMTIATDNPSFHGGQVLQHSSMPNAHSSSNAVSAVTSGSMAYNHINPKGAISGTSAVNNNADKSAKESAIKNGKLAKDIKSKPPPKQPISAISRVAASKQAAVDAKSLAKKGTNKRPNASSEDEPAAKMAKTKKLTKKDLADEAKRASLEKSNQAALAAVSAAAAKNKGGNAKPAAAGSGASTSQAGNSGSGHTEDHRRAVLKQQIQRLLLLRHASKCPHEANRCPVTTYCSSMKTLWKHLMKCKDQECKVPHCVSSRYVLSHYSKCQDSHCPVCGPVRASIRKASSDNSEIARNLSDKNDQGQNKKARTEEKPAPAQQQPPDSLSSAIYNFTDDQIKYHMTHLHDGLRMKASDVRSHLLPLVDEMIRHPNGYIFATPVDPVHLQIPDYPDIIKRPMDLGTIRKRLETSYYRDLTECANDIRLTFDNAMLYNPTTTDVHKCAQHFKRQFEKSFKLRLEQNEKATEERRKHPDSCRLCGEKDLYFEIPNYYCNGKCASRIKKNSVYYSDEKNTLHWCQSCYHDLRDPIKVVGSGNLYKKDLKKSKLQGETEELREPMVCCDGCERWVHYVCGLFNGRRNLSKEMQYFCPSCVLQQRAKLPEKKIVPEKKMLASTLPHCLLSEFIEKRVLSALEKSYAESAEKLDIPIEEVEKAPPLSVRQVSCIDNNHRTQEGMKKRYAHKNYPAEFPCRAKCILLFQHIDGQDVILFGMYVYEYGHKCPQPNQRRVYISYLDSVHYLRPRQYRTPVYHEILIAYLEYVKMRGFHTAHIWACPPMPKDDYIFNIHPPDQKTPKQERLRQWYVSMLDKCVERGIVKEVTDLHTEFMVNEQNDATVLPYLDGDYWVGLAEDVIKKLAQDDQGNDDNDSAVGNDKSKRKKKNWQPPKRNRGRQSRGVAPANVSGRDPVMEKIAATIEPMKHDFFVARLHSKEYVAACAQMAEEERVSTSSGDNETMEKKLQEEALSSGETGKHSKMNSKFRKMSKSDSLASFGQNEASTAPSDPTAGSGSGYGADSAASNSNDAGISKADTATVPSTGHQDAPASVSSDANKHPNAQSNSSESNQTTGECEAKASASQNEVEGSSMEIDGEQERNNSAESKENSEDDKGLLASVSKLASSLFRNEGNEQNSDKMEVDGEEKANVTESGREHQQETCEAKETQETESLHNRDVTLESDKVVIKEEKPSGDEAAASGGFAKESNDGNTQVKKEIKEEEKPEVKDSCTDKADKSSTSGDNVLTKDTEDRDDTQECEHFETRLSFLQLCQGNHYQFDQLRRAKHSSMMVLYHLHNPDAPKFMAVCHVPTCTQSIVTGTRYHCDTCDIDFCQSCYAAQRDPKLRHNHPLRPMLVAGSTSALHLTEEQRRERNRSIQLHLQLLLHSAKDCIGKTCSSKNCQKMKEFLKHEPNCSVGIKKGCPMCKKVLNLLNLHARSCRIDNCPVPKCMEIKERARQNQLKQRQMDERRRQMMNDMYSRSKPN